MSNAARESKRELFWHFCKAVNEIRSALEKFSCQATNKWRKVEKGSKTVTNFTKQPLPSPGCWKCSNLRFSTHFWAFQTYPLTWPPSSPWFLWFRILSLVQDQPSQVEGQTMQPMGNTHSEWGKKVEKIFADAGKGSAAESTYEAGPQSVTQVTKKGSTRVDNFHRCWSYSVPDNTPRRR